MNQNNHNLVVLGAGPKACAIWTKHCALQESGISVAPMTIIEKTHVGASWTGANGYTDGLQLLVSPSEQDLGFPYSADVFGAELANRLTEQMFKYSWQNYLLTVGGYPEWVSSDRPRAHHYQFRDYLAWAGRATNLTTIKSEITKISIDENGQWQLFDQTQKCISSALGLVITGNGKPRRLHGQPEKHDRIWDGETFWANKQKLGEAKFARIAVIGSGETAAAIASSILDDVGTDVVIELICKQYAYFTRAEVAKDLIYFSDPSHWKVLREGRRFSIMRRADRGVVSAPIKKRLEESKQVEYTTAEAGSLEVSAQDELFLSLNYDGQTEKVLYQYIVVATGFDAMWYFELFDESTKMLMLKHLCKELSPSELETLADAIQDKPTPENWLDNYKKNKASRFLERSIERLIDKDLSLRNFSPKLHLPAMAGLAQGPGFPNLNCLGLLSDRILKTYVP